MSNRVDDMLSHLTYIRSFTILGIALATKFPTAKSWEEAAMSETFTEGLYSLAKVLEDIRTATEMADLLDVEEIEDIGGQHHERALEAITEISNVLSVDPEDVVVVLTNG